MRARQQRVNTPRPNSSKVNSMNSGRGPGKTRAASRRRQQLPARGRNATRPANAPSQINVSNVYREMLDEAGVAEGQNAEPSKPLIKRKIPPNRQIPRRSVEGTDEEVRSTASSVKDVTTPSSSKAIRQTIEDSSENDGYSEDDFAFEDVDLEHTVESETAGVDDTKGISDVTISLDSGKAPSTPHRRRRLPGSSVDKAFRLVVHKAHILCLLGHCMYVNSWCNNKEVHQLLRPLLSDKLISYLNPNVNFSQFQRNRSFIDGLQGAAEVFRGRFVITGSGLRRARWTTDDMVANLDEDTELIDLSAFKSAARDCRGSQDTANQLFCALLRAAGVATRLVCSLQTLPFGSAPTLSPQKGSNSNPKYVTDKSGTNIQELSNTAKIPPTRRRLGKPCFGGRSDIPAQTKKKNIQKLSYPVFWVEALNAAYQKWVPVDPIVTQTVNKASKLEPPTAYSFNQMVYVIAFESTGVARDVTRRYAKAYNSKTRRLRVESSDGGTEWIRSALRIFRPHYETPDRDQVEDAELAQREAREGLPNNVQDFKDHPYYALERHLKRHEVIHPKREVGKVNAGTAANPRMEIVFRRRDVQACRSADKWFRLGRIIAEGEQPLKHVPSRRARARSPRESGVGTEENSMTALYAFYQTELYIPPPIVAGRVPRNAFGNLDIYVPSMVPAGGVHIPHELASHAAKILKVDYADAVTGFRFQGRRGTAVIEGVVIAAEHAEAVRAVIEGLQEDQAEMASLTRSAMALKMWKHMLVGLRILERVKTHIGTTADTVMSTTNPSKDFEDDATSDAGGGFYGSADTEIAMPTAGKFSLHELGALTKGTKKRRRKSSSGEEVEEGKDDGSMQDADSLFDGYDAASRRTNTTDTKRVPRPVTQRRRIVEDHDEADVAENDDENGGGFLPEEPTEIEQAEEIDYVHHSKDESVQFDGEAGGGFLLDDQAGGFLVDEDQPNSNTKEVFNNVDENRFRAPTALEGVNMASETSVIGHDSEDDIAEESKQGTSLRETVQGDESTGVFFTTKATSPDTSMQDFDETETERVVIGENLVPKPTEGSDKDGGSEGSSMLSHDPEDEDAEPDWLDSD